ncbi:uncharacterized protein LOC141739700 isoform X2 [Larus michahellis]|uniref:uncharacterized protein LOC141739700 isoform X2 n=1 Tax=Larus michahellis TaxID=119627 RepID=UPI003D9B1BE5
MFAEGGRQILDTQQQSSAHEDNPSSLEAYRDLEGRLKKVENEIRLMDREGRVWSDSVESRLQFLERCYRHKELLSKAMSMHKDSENMNDVSRLSAVLQMYEMLRLRDWQKFKTECGLTYQTGHGIIKELFNACEKDIEQRTTSIFEVLGISPSNDAMTNSKEAMMPAIRNLFRYHYYQSDTEFYSKIISHTGFDPRPAPPRQFAQQCCKVYCLLLLQDPPVKAAWNLQESPVQYLEHVDKKDRELWGKITLLWPIMKCGEEVIVRGVVWDEN